MSALGTGLLLVRWNFLVGIGAVDMLSVYGGSLAPFSPLALSAVAALWLFVLLAFGFAARAGHRWAFLVGIVLYGADMVALMLLFSRWAFGVHAFFVFRWYQGQKALKEITKRRFPRLSSYPHTARIAPIAR